MKWLFLFSWRYQPFIILDLCNDHYLWYIVKFLKKWGMCLFFYLAFKFCLLLSFFFFFKLRAGEGEMGGDYNVQNRTLTNKVKVKIANQLSY